MKNLIIKLPLVDGGELPLDFNNGKELIEQICGDDFAAPPRFLCIEAKTKDNKTVTINVPYDQKVDEAYISIRDN
ncbi:MAG: hypothetical protein Q8Q08_03615 [Candidatus Omnitrophota bacterium]|nr:hypothetical protein [Candidatus Omnitrophota bacterium]